MEDLLLGAGKYVAGALGAMVFMFVLDVLCTSRAEQEQDKEDAKDGILRGKEAGRFVAMAEKNVREYEKNLERLRNLNAIAKGTTDGGFSRRGALLVDSCWPIPEPEPEELSPYQAGQAAYCLGKEAEDNPFREDAYLGSEWEAGYYNSMKGDIAGWNY